MNITDVINILALIIAPIIAVLIGYNLQNSSKKRDDKMKIFKILMTARAFQLTNDMIYALNVLEIVFADDALVIKCWKEFYDKLCIENPTETDLNKIRNAQYKLLEAISNTLGYKKTVTWETIQNPYIPKGLTEQSEQQRKQSAMIMNTLEILATKKEITK